MNPGDPLVSILVPCHNAAPWLRDTLESALAQTWRPLEVILVDDGSTDGSAAILREFDAPELTVLHRPARGAAAARNTALAAAHGQYVRFLDADDLLAPDATARQVAAMAGRIDCVALAAQWKFFETPATAWAGPAALHRETDPVAWLCAAWTGVHGVHPAAWLVPATLARSVGPWDEHLTLNDDGEYFTRVLLASSGVVHVPEATTYYRVPRPGSLAWRRGTEAWESLARSIERATGHLLAVENSPRTRLAAASAWQEFVFTVYPESPELVARAEAALSPLGGYTRRPAGSLAFRLVAALAGWRLALRWRRARARRRSAERAPAPLPPPSGACPP
jgi:glycosyltransferase involved in cell wall biosynthesis